MGFNYGQRRNRGESLSALRETVLASLGETDIHFQNYDFQQTADYINAILDRQQEKYNRKYNFPDTKKPVQR